MIKHTITFILHKDHVIIVSWGDKQFMLGPDEIVTIPRLCHKIPPKEIWNSHASLLEKKSDGLGRSSFYYLIQDLTVSNREIVTSVDYLQALLVAEPIEVLQEIIKSLVPTVEAIKSSQYVAATSTFLKYRYNYHVTVTDDDCSTHHLTYILGRNSDFNLQCTDSDFNSKNGITCSKC